MTTARGPQFKMVLLGEFGVGKKSLFFRIKDESFVDGGKRHTMGIDSCSRLVKLDETSHLTFALFDTADVERYHSLTKNYYRNTHVCVLAYSLTSPDSLHRLPRPWMEDARDFSPKSLKVLVGNKCDLERTVKQKLVDDFAAMHDIDLTFTVSAKTGEGIEEMLDTIASTLMARNKLSKSNETKQQAKTDMTEKEKKTPCRWC